MGQSLNFYEIMLVVSKVVINGKMLLYIEMRLYWNLGKF